MGIAFERQYKLSSSRSTPGNFSGSCAVRVIGTKYNRAAIKIIRASENHTDSITVY
jgi:hypothetical protein